MRALFDTGSEADAVSIEKATELRQHRVSWGESGGNLRVADSREARPVGGVVLGNEEFEPDEDQDTDELDELWPGLDNKDFVMPTLKGTPEQHILRAAPPV